MNDITVLALLVSKAKASAFTMEYISQFEASDIDSDDVDLRFEVDGVETGTNVSIVDECGQAAQMIWALVEALEKAQRANTAQDDHINQQQDRIDILEKRNAELGKHVGMLEKRLRGTEESLIASVDMVRELESRTVTVKLPTDSADSDVSSRNQPGMVVAVHIDAGDFVKVKGQVFEVEETDFDDHDVTLWFVGGDVLRCAAGCQVEVVAAPDTAGIQVIEGEGQ